MITSKRALYEEYNSNSIRVKSSFIRCNINYKSEKHEWSKIGANSVITKSIEENETVICIS